MFRRRIIQSANAKNAVREKRITPLDGALRCAAMRENTQNTKNWRSQSIDLNQKPGFKYTDLDPCAQIRSRLRGHCEHCEHFERFERSGKYKAKSHDQMTFPKTLPAVS